MRRQTIPRVLFHVALLRRHVLMIPNSLIKVIAMIAQPRPLIEVFADISDFRKPRGKRHPLPAILSLSCCARFCGFRSESAMAEWGRTYGTAIAHTLGFTHQPPCAVTLHTIFGR